MSRPDIESIRERWESWRGKIDVQPESPNADVWALLDYVAELEKRLEVIEDARIADARDTMERAQ